MTIDHVLIGLQALLLGLHGITGVVYESMHKKTRWIVACVVFLVFAISCIWLEDYVRNNIQLLLIMLLGSHFLLYIGGFSAGKSLKIAIAAGIAFAAYALLYLHLQLTVAWLVVPFILICLIGLLHKQFNFLLKFQDYALKAGVLLTLFFMVEPVVLEIQKNLKPIATIPLASVINQQNILLLAALMVLTLGGFLWKEKIRP
ncbi:MAG: hypothetical protein AAFQ94_07135 [Bacteroidota bacterium]